MAYPAVNTASITTTTTSSSGTTHNLLMPASIAAGDLLVAWIEYSGGGGNVSLDTSVGAWTKVFDVNPPTTTQNGCLFWKWATGSEDGATVVATSNGSARSIGNVFQITGAYNSQNPTFAWNTTNSFDPPSVTASWGTGENLFIAFAASAINGVVNFTAAPTGYSNLTSKTGANSGGIGQASKQSTSATDDPATFSTNGGSFYVSATMVVSGVPAQTITSVNGGSPITFGQTGIPVVAAGFTSKPTSVTASYSGGTITATIDSGGSATNFNFSIQDRVEGQDWPDDGATVTYEFTYSAESASATNAISKKTDETNVVYAGAVIDDDAYLTYWLNAAGFTVEGGSLIYTQPPATGTMPTPDLVLTTDGGGSVSEACVFESWFRPVTGTGAGNVYFYRWSINGGGITPSSSGGLTSAGLTSVGLTNAGLTRVGL